MFLKHSRCIIMNVPGNFSYFPDIYASGGIEIKTKSKKSLKSVLKFVFFISIVIFILQIELILIDLNEKQPTYHNPRRPGRGKNH